MKRSPIKRRARTKHQLANVDHREYVQWIHTQPCAACGTRQNIQAAHVGQGGMGMKHGSDADVIPLCGPRVVWEGHAEAAYMGKPFFITTSRVTPGCHTEHDQLTGYFRNWKLSRMREWNELQIAVHRGRFEARNVGVQVVPF